jgi:hypothetical protein
MIDADCPSPEQPSASVLGELVESERSRVADHFESCTRCEQQAGPPDALSEPVLAG